MCHTVGRAVNKSIQSQVDNNLVNNVNRADRWVDVVVWWCFYCCGANFATNARLRWCVVINRVGCCWHDETHDPYHSLYSHTSSAGVPENKNKPQIRSTMRRKNIHYRKVRQDLLCVVFVLFGGTGWLTCEWCIYLSTLSSMVSRAINEASIVIALDLHIRDARMMDRIAARKRSCMECWLGWVLCTIT